MSQGTAKGRGSAGGAARLRGQGTPPPFLVPLSGACTGAQGPAPPEAAPPLGEASRDQRPPHHPPPTTHRLRPLPSGLASTPPRREWERRSQDRAGAGGGATGRTGGVGGTARRKVRRGWGVPPSLRVAVRGPRARGHPGALGRRKPGAPLARPGSGRGARQPRGGSRSAGLAAATKVSCRSRGHPSFSGPGRRGDPRARTVSEGDGAPSPSRPRASIAPNSDSQLGRRRGPAHARLPRRCRRRRRRRRRRLLRLRLRLRLLRRGAGSGPSRAPRLAPRAQPSGSRSAVPAHADAGRPPGAPSPEDQLSADRRRRREVGPARRCPRQRQVWELH
ncbi:serine/arginine repetitive matrix protein 3-like isoform X1 [Zalophus californianus]|uniref:Serine/arginine repetitive matrix protein 3-like isoform X1 n=1 Tax=Zalophus californianus TaxID=9704 RepID=A0A6J2BJK4_ZALCA|nr:serine/arginine repetitive matrix protein 3-like isoform X1 [Zalophus californianus]